MNTQVEQAENVVKSKLPRAFVGGFVGTVLFTLMGMFVAPKVIGQPRMLQRSSRRYWTYEAHLMLI